MTKLTYVRIFADEAGQSHLEEQCVQVGGDAALSAFPTQFSDPIGVTAARFSVMPPHFVAEWHPAPRRQYSLHLSGELEVEVSDGQKCRLGPGSIVLLEDVSGQGHRTTVIGDQPVVGVFLHLP